jgi:hypothetical protein
MRRIAKIGYTQSYTYFTWRNARKELEEYCNELFNSDLKLMLRPNFFANTPDILHEYLQKGGRAAFMAREVLAATLSPSYGIYSGFELCENVPLREGSEEYRDSETYQIKVRDGDQPGNIKPLITVVNRIRREHKALQSSAHLRFCSQQPLRHRLRQVHAGLQGRRRHAVNVVPRTRAGGMVTLPDELFHHHLLPGVRPADEPTTRGTGRRTTSGSIPTCCRRTCCTSSAARSRAARPRGGEGRGATRVKEGLMGGRRLGAVSVVLGIALLGASWAWLRTQPGDPSDPAGGSSGPGLREARSPAPTPLSGSEGRAAAGPAAAGAEAAEGAGGEAVQLALGGKVYRQGGPAAGAEVRYGQARTTSAADGSFELSAPCDASRGLVASQGPLTSLMRVFDCGEPPAYPGLVLVLRGASSIRGEVRDEQGGPCAPP